MPKQQNISQKREKGVCTDMDGYMFLRYSTAAVHKPQHKDTSSPASAEEKKRMHRYAHMLTRRSSKALAPAKQPKKTHALGVVVRKMARPPEPCTAAFAACASRSMS